MAGSRRGAALLLVIVIVGLLAFLVTEFQRKAHLKSVSAANSLLAAQAHALTRSGAAAAQALLAQQMGNATDDRTELWYFGDDEDSAQPIPVGEYAVSLYIEDQYGKFPIGALVDQNGKPVANRVAAFRSMIVALDIANVNPDDVTDALVDWIDDDSSNDHFEDNDRFTVPNARIAHLDELSRVAVFSDLRPDAFRKILSRLDTRSAPEVNVNTASAEVLVSLHPSVTLADAQALRDTLGATPDASGSVIAPTIPPAGRALPVVFRSKRFRVVAKGDADGVIRRADCLLEETPNGKSYKIVDWIQY